MSERPPYNQSLADRWRQSQDDVARLRDENRSGTPEPDAAAAPARCPVCRSEDVSTTSKAVSADAYWRCGACGEVWNVGRHRAGARYGREQPPFRR